MSAGGSIASRSSLCFEGPLRSGAMLRVGHALPEDAASMVAYAESVCAESDFLAFGPGEFGLSIEDERKFLAGLEGGRFNFMLKGTVDGAVVSACMVTRGVRPRLRHLGTFGLSVRRSHWGLGVGERMSLTMLDVARQVGVTKVDLEVREDNHRAIALYERLGFAHEGRSVRALRVGGQYFDNLRMGRCLD